MRFYKKIDENGNHVLIATTAVLSDPSLREISAEEYNELEQQQEQIDNTAGDAISEKSKDERIAELEKENAALLYQVLTGEEYADA